MHPYATNSPAPPKHIGVLMLIAVGFSIALGYLINYANATFNWSLGSVSAMTIFMGLYFLFDHAVWKWKWTRKILLVPDLNGEWVCDGVTRFRRGEDRSDPWSGTITIRQSWSRITVVLRTAQSGSRSIAASLYQEPGQGYRLIYHYDNKPQLGEPELARHCGLCTLLFSDEVDSATGEYFTDKDRVTAGTMRLSRKGRNDAKVGAS